MVRHFLIGGTRQLIALLLVWGLAGTTLAQASAPVKIALPGEPQTLDPHRYNLRLEETLLNDLFMGLTTFNAAGEIVGGAAESWQTSADGLTWTFTLRQGLRWSDGTPLTAHDFVYAFQRLQDPATAASLAYFMHMLKGAAAINAGQLDKTQLGAVAQDNRTLVLTLTQPYPFLLERLLYPTAYPVPRHVIEAHPDNWVKPEHWVSNGAYLLHDWTPRAQISLQRNTHFYQPATIERIDYIPIVSEQSAYNRYRTGELDVVGGFPVGELPKLQASAASDLRISSLLSMMYLVFNTSQPPFDDVRVRQALSLAIDQTIITDKVLRSGNVAELSFVPAQIANYIGVPLPHTDQAYAQRIAAAKALLDAAGYGPAKPLKITLRHVNSAENKKVNLAISGMWRALGVQTRLQQNDLRTHFGDLRQGNFSVAWAGWVGENNAEHYLSLLQSDIGSVNYGRFANKTFDAVMQQAQQQAAVADRNNLLRTAEEIAVHYYPVVPLYSTAVRRLVNPALEGWIENGRDMHQSRYLSWQ